MSEDNLQQSTANARSADFPFDNWALNLETALGKLSGRIRHCGKNAFRCLRQGWKLSSIDPEMAVFRGITAKEEAATALILALKQRNYPDADKLNHRDHVHKTGLIPFIATLETLLANSGFPTPQVQLNYGADTPRIDVHLSSADLGMPAGYFATPDEPLNMLISQGRKDFATAQVSKFEQQLAKTAEYHGEKDLLTAIRKEANLRNQILYATDDGIARVENADAALISYRKPVLLLLTLVIAILQTKKHQLLAVQSVSAYVTALKRVPTDDFDYRSALGLHSNAEIILDKSLAPSTQVQISRPKPNPDIK